MYKIRGGKSRQHVRVLGRDIGATLGQGGKILEEGTRTD